jgi:hypothetical protein
LSNKRCDAVLSTLERNTGASLSGVANSRECSAHRTELAVDATEQHERIAKEVGVDPAFVHQALSDDKHVVAMQSEGRWPLAFATLVLAVGATSGTFAVLGLEAANGLLPGLGLVAGSAATTVGAAVGCARWWARAIREALRRSLTSLASSAKLKRSSWLSRRHKKH